MYVSTPKTAPAKMIPTTSQSTASRSPRLIRSRCCFVSRAVPSARARSRRPSVTRRTSRTRERPSRWVRAARFTWPGIESRRRGHLAKAGSPHLRWALVEAAVHAHRATAPDLALYRATRQRRDTTVARLTVARKIGKRAFHALRELELATA
jgi:hypothetical protein